MVWSGIIIDTRSRFSSKVSRWALHLCPLLYSFTSFHLLFISALIDACAHTHRIASHFIPSASSSPSASHRPGDDDSYDSTFSVMLMLTIGIQRFCLYTLSSNLFFFPPFLCANLCFLYLTNLSVFFSKLSWWLRSPPRSLLYSISISVIIYLIGSGISKS